MTTRTLVAADGSLSLGLFADLLVEAQFAGLNHDPHGGIGTLGRNHLRPSWQRR